jgi:hypothetical protein
MYKPNQKENTMQEHTTDPKVKEALLGLVEVCRQLNISLSRTQEEVSRLKLRVYKLEMIPLRRAQ